MSKKNILLLIVAVAVVTVFSFIVVSNKTPQQQNQTSADNGKEVDTGEWKVYRNEEYGFEVDYPSSLTIKDWAHKTPNYLLLLYIGENKGIGDGAVSIGIERDINSFSPKVVWPFNIKDLNLEEITIGKDNYSVKKTSCKISEVDTDSEEYRMSMGIGALDFINYYIEHSGFLYVIHYNKFGGLDKDSFNKILSSFKFIDSE